MSFINSIYISRVEKKYSAEFIAELLRKSGLAKVSKIAIEPYKSSLKPGTIKYNHVYVEIKSWIETEAAYNFIQRLKNPNRETRLVYEDDFWWTVEINKYPHKLSSHRNKGCVLTIYQEISEDKAETFDDLSALNPVISAPKIDYELTNLLKSLIFDGKYADNLADVNDMDAYLCEMHSVRDIWFSEQYIYDQLVM